MKHKNDYSVTVFFNDKTKPKKWGFVHKLNGFALFLDKDHSNWEYFNVYDRRTGNFIQRIKKGSFIPAFIE